MLQCTAQAVPEQVDEEVPDGDIGNQTGSADALSIAARLNSSVTPES